MKRSELKQIIIEVIEESKDQNPKVKKVKVEKINPDGKSMLKSFVKRSKGEIKLEDEDDEWIFTFTGEDRGKWEDLLDHIKGFTTRPKSIEKAGKK